ncbi:VCBS domain-containing protein [Shewanella sp. 10N.286.51.B8]|uniref:VCBS domain-containing protein n=2 Tax=unclassified Shewanella TaxID=196818 RepID=UPI00354D9676
MTVTINGTDDKAVIAGTSTAQLTEDKDVHGGQLRVDGTLTVTDVDSGQNQFQATSLQGQFGTLSINELGHWTYTADNSQPSIQGLKTGGTVTDTVLVHSVDGTEQKITVTINGTDDKALIAGTSTANLTEDKDVHGGQLRVDGALTVTDLDAGQSQFTATSLQGQFGTLSINNLGHWTYAADNSQPNIQGLKTGESLTDTLIVHSVDGTEQKVTVTINGTDDKAVVAGTSTAQLTEDKDVHQGQLHVDGALTVTDVDTGQNQFQATVQQGQFGALSLNELGYWTYTADNSQPAIQGLKTGESLTDTLVVHSVDGTEQKITVTINGTDDKAVIGGTSSAQLTEDKDVHQGQLHVDGALTVTDVDNGQNQFQATVQQGQFGSLALNELGHWTYTADNSQPSIQSLKTGETVTDTLVVHSIDGTEQQITVTINGTDDKAVITGISTGDVDEGHGSFGDMSPDYAQPGMAKLGQAALTADGKLDIVDPDTGESQFDSKGGAWNNSYHGQYGHLLLNSDGTWHYDVTVGSVDWVGNRKTTIGSTIDKLGEGQTLTDTITIQSKDGTSHDIVITIHGDNDRPYCSSEVVIVNGSEDTRQTLTTAQLLANTVDVDTNDAGLLTIENLHADHGSILNNADGSFTFTPETDYNGSVHFNYDVKDAHGGITHTGASTTLAAVGDAAIITGVDTGSITENSAGVDMSPDYAHSGIATLGNTTLYADGKLTITDPDVGESGFERQGSNGYDYHGTYGDLILLTDGTWHYHADAGHLSGIGARPTTRGTAIDQLGEGQSLTDTITVHSKDGTTHDIVITIHGSNDKPYCSSEVVLQSGSEDTRQTLTTAQLLTNTVDVDKNDAGKLTIENLHANHGSILNNDDGTFTFTPEKDYNGQVHFTYDVKDAHGGITHTGASTTLAAVGDAAQIAGVDTGSISENTAGTDMSPDYAQPGIATLGNTTLYADGKLTITDPDVGESGFERQGSNGYDYHGTYGDLILLTDGTWHYHADAGHLSGIGARPTTRGTAIDQLGEGQSLTDTITVHSKDGTTHDIVITIHGSNDRPYCSSEVVLQSGSEDTRQTLTTAQLLANTVDVDANDAGKLTIENLHANHGSILINADGTFTFTPEKDYNGDVHFSYDVKDAHGGVTHTSATTNLAAVNDNPDVTPLTDSVSEGADNHHTLNLLLGATDKEGDALTISHLEYAIDGQPQSGQLPTGITLDTDGHTLIVDATNPAFNHLANGQSQQIAITYQVEDGHGGSTQQTATLTIAGTDDKAALVSNVIQLTETQALDSEFKFYRGQLQLIDPDSGDNTQFVFSGKYLGQGFEPGHLDVWPNGTYQFRLEAVTNRHADDLIGSLHAGESMELPYEIETNDGQKLTIMVKVTGEDNQAKIEVTPYSSLNNHVYEDHTSFGNTTNQLSSGGTLQVIDPDHDQAVFIAQTITTAEGGRFNINAKGHWSYDIDNDKVQHLGAGESFQQTFTVESIDGSAKKDITVTVHGTNDAPVASAEVRLANGLEDTQIVLTPAQLLANTTDIDDNDIGKLSIENLQADHGAIALNADGTFTFTPEKDYNGDVHFSYDVKDAHGGVTHTGASTTLAAVNDAALINGQSQASSNVDIFEDGATSRLTGQLTLTDVDSGENQFATISQLAGQYGYLSMDQQGNWSYTLDNSLATTNGLVAGQVVTESFTLTSPDGTASHTINVQIHGHDDTPSVSVNEGGAVKSLDLLGGLSSGTVSHMQFSTDGVHYTNQVPDGFMLAGDGHTLQVDPAHNSYNHLANGIALKVDIKYELQQGAGSNVQTSQQQAQVVVTGTSDRPIIHSFNPHSQQNNGPVTGNLLQGATDVDDGAQLVLDDVQFQDPVTHHYVTVQAGQTHNITGVGVIAISANGDYTFTPNSQFRGQVPNLIYRVTDTNGDYADNSQNNLTIHIDPYQAPIIIAPLAVSLAHDTGSSATDLITQDGALSISGQTAGMQVEYSTDGGAHWSSQFTPVEGLNQLQVRQTDNAGHTSKATSIDFTLDTNVAAPHISLDPITADDVLNQAELSGSVPVTGTVGSEVSVGDNITLTLGTHTYTGAVDAQHRFSIDIPANQLSSHTNISASVTITDTAGNNATATDNHHYSTDTNAAIRVNPITSDNIIEASEHQQAVDITGTVSGVEDGQTVTVTIAGQQHQAVVTQGAWHTSLTAAEVQALPGGTVDVTASVQDLAGNLASIHSPLFISDSANPVPTLSFKTPPTPTGSGSIGSHISGDLVAPPIIQQLSPSLSGAGWAITDGHGHTSTSLQGQYGTLSIDPVTGHVDYVYRQAPTAGNKATGGSHWAGQTTSEEHHDVFQVVYHDAHASNVDVKVNVDVTYVHGHSGHNQTSTHLVGMTITPDTSAAPPPAADMNDVPDDIMTFSASITEDEPSFDEVLVHIGADDESSPEHPEGAHSLNQSGASSPIDHYLQMVGVSHADMNPTPQATVVNDLANVAETLAAPDADMLDANQVDAFENPLDDDNHQQHKDELLADLNDQPDQSDTNQANDDDLLHQALNDMHNQV